MARDGDTRRAQQRVTVRMSGSNHVISAVNVGGTGEVTVRASSTQERDVQPGCRTPRPPKEET